MTSAGNEPVSAPWNQFGKPPSWSANRSRTSGGASTTTGSSDAARSQLRPASMPASKAVSRQAATKSDKRLGQQRLERAVGRLGGVAGGVEHLVDRAARGR